MLEASAVERNIPYCRTDEGLMLSLTWGDIHATREQDGMRLTLTADDRHKLHLLQEAVDRRLDEAGVAMDRRWSLTEPGSYPPNLAFTEVVSCEQITPSFYRVAVAGPSLARFMQDGLHFRLLFPPTTHVGSWPVLSDSGRVEWPGGIAAWHRPVYTTRSFDAAMNTLTFDVFVHDGGRTSDWCGTLRPGAQAAIMGPGGEWHPQAGWLALFGDETALPAIARILEARADDALGAATIMVGDPGDVQELKAPRGTRIRWLIRGGGETLLDALEKLTLPVDDRFVWFAGERSEVAKARDILLDRGMSRGDIRTASYWSL